MQQTPVLIAIIILSAVWGVAVATGRDNRVVLLSLLVGAVGFGLEWAAIAGWLPADLGMLGLMLAAIAGGVAAARTPKPRLRWPWRRSNPA